MKVDHLFYSLVKLLMVQWVVRLIPHDGPIEPFLVATSAPQLV